ncbi:MAG TPA: hypothetical protein VMB73_18685 [Acetobacteraceae bacterium]|jgi:hypothetical protein|nr:hypothetical protein [Acetobacteraceae bacterium]
MEMHLVVVKPFDGLARGDIIKDETRISAILSSEHARSVVRVAAQMPGKV